MNILMMSNTYKPVLGGLERSIEVAANEYRKRGHEVLIVCPEYKGVEDEEGVLRIPALKNLGENKFSLQVPLSGIEDKILQRFRPDIIHLQHPFLIAENALRISEKCKIPLILTYHTLFEQNIDHYLPNSLDIMKKFIIQLFTGFAGLCDAVIAPSGSIKEFLKEEHDVVTPIEVIPTGIYVKDFDKPDRLVARKKLGIHPEIRLIGFISRISKEKNVDFLMKSVAGAMEKEKDLHFLVAGKGNHEEDLREYFNAKNLNTRLHFTGELRGEDLVLAYHALDAFVFASKSETQGIVLAEAMASGIPVIALDAPGVRDIVKNDFNGIIVDKEDAESFTGSILKYINTENNDEMKKNARKTAEKYSVEKCINKTLSMYERLIGVGKMQEKRDKSKWEKQICSLKAEWQLLSNVGSAAKELLK